MVLVNDIRCACDLLKHISQYCSWVWGEQPTDERSVVPIPHAACRDRRYLAGLESPLFTSQQFTRTPMWRPASRHIESLAQQWVNNNVPNDCWLTKVQSSALRSYHSINALAQSPALAILALVRTWSALKFPAMLSKGLRFDVCSLSFSLKGEQLCMMLLRHALMEIH